MFVMAFIFNKVKDLQAAFVFKSKLLHQELFQELYSEHLLSITTQSGLTPDNCTVSTTNLVKHVRLFLK